MQGIQRPSLRFSAAIEAEHPGLEADFQREHNEAAVSHLRGVAGLLLAVYAVYLPLTYAFFGPALRTLPVVLGLETFGLLVTAAFLAFSYTPGFVRSLQEVTSFTAACVGAQAAAVSLLFPHPFDYIALTSVMLLLMCVYTAVRLRFAAATAAGCSVVAAFVVEAALFGQLGRDAAIQLGVYLGTANVLGMLAAFRLERTQRHDYLQTRRLAAEQARSERLLLNVLPPSIATRLKAGERTIADSLPEASVLFADVVGFTPLASTLTAEQLVGVLDALFQRWDALVTRLGLEKIKTIGDAYMAAGGVPDPRPDHVEAVAELALGMRDVVHALNAEHGWSLDVRIGVHTGPLVAGVIGRRKFTYDLWGDTVNTASRMESHGEPGRIHLSEAAAERLAGGYVIEPRGELQVKGKGVMRTAFLVARREPSA